MFRLFRYPGRRSWLLNILFMSHLSNNKIEKKSNRHHKKEDYYKMKTSRWDKVTE